MATTQVTTKLEEVKSQIPGIKAKGVEHRRSADFHAWKEKGIKWLKLGQPHTSHELKQFENLVFMNFRVRAWGEGDGYDDDDEDQYEKDCDLAINILDSAIENIEGDLVPGDREKQPPSRQKRGEGSKFGGVNIAQAGTVVMGDKNIVAKIDSITVSDFLKVLEKEIQEKVQDPQHKTTVLQKVKAISQNPAVNTVLGQTIGQILRSMSGQ